MRRRTLLLGLLLLTLGPAPALYWLGSRALDELEDRDRALRRTEAAGELCGWLEALRDEAPSAPLALDRPEQSAVAAEPAAEFLAALPLLAARSALGNRRPVEALERLEKAFGGAAAPAERAAAQLLAARILDGLGRERSAGLLRAAALAAAAGAELAPAVARWLRLGADLDVPESVCAASAAAEAWLAEVEGRATDLEELALLADLAARAADGDRLKARLRERARLPERAAALRARARALEPAAFAIVLDGERAAALDLERATAWELPDLPARIASWRGSSGATAALAAAGAGALDGDSAALSGTERRGRFALDLGGRTIGLDLPAPRLFGPVPPRALLLGGLLLYAALALSLAAAVAAQQRRAAELVQARDDLIAQVTHEVRTPLTVLRMYAESLAAGRVAEDARAQYLATIAAEAERLGLLVDRVAATARGDGDSSAGASAPPLDPRPVLLAALAPHQQLARERGLSLSASIAADLGAVAIESEDLRLALEVLLENALAYGAAPISVAAERTGTTLAISVTDRGPGVQPAERARLFQRFTRGSAGRASGRRGAGMGLFLARRTARAAGGELALEFPQEGGTRARLTLPLAREGGR